MVNKRGLKMRWTTRRAACGRPWAAGGDCGALFVWHKDSCALVCKLQAGAYTRSLFSST